MAQRLIFTPMARTVTPFHQLSHRVDLAFDRGVIFVIGHIRGGGEMGEEWRKLAG